MYATHQAMGAYKSQNVETLSSRAVEYRVFAQITSRIENAFEANDKVGIIKALADNLLLWNALATDVMVETNELPENLRAQIIYLAKYMHHHTKLIRNEEGDATAIIDINKMMMEGLNQTAPPPNNLIETQDMHASEAFSSFVAGA